MKSEFITIVDAFAWPTKLVTKMSFHFRYAKLFFFGRRTVEMLARTRKKINFHFKVLSSGKIIRRLKKFKIPIAHVQKTLQKWKEEKIRSFVSCSRIL